MGPETRRRGATVRWTSSAEDGDAAEAVAEIEAWLTTDPARQADWAGVLADLREALLRAGVAPLLVDDAPARAILLGLAEAADPAALDAGVAALGARLDALLAGRAAARERAALAGPRTVAEMGAAEMGAAEMGGAKMGGAEGRRPGPRSLLRL